MVSVPFVAGAPAPVGNVRATTSTDDTTYGSALIAEFIDPTNDAGIWMPVAVGDVVWYDVDHDGVQDGGAETGVEGVTVTLFNADGSRAIDAVGVLVPVAVTDPTGFYVFGNLLPGDYYVEFTNIPVGYSFTLRQAAGDVNVDSNPAVDGVSPVFTLSVNGANMSPNTNPAIVGTVIDPTIDAGIWLPVAVGDYVWYDVDRDGVQDSTETPIQNVVVELLDGSGNPAVDADGILVPAVITDVNGHYVFDNLIPGDYQLQFVLPNGAVVSPQFNDPDEMIDSNPDPTGLTPVFSVGAGEVNTTPVVAADGVNVAAVIDRTIDAGIFSPLAIGDYVWYDANRNGIQESAEIPVSGVSVELLDADGNPVLDIDANPVPATVTDGVGHYVFDNLGEGVYTVKFTNLPAGYQFTRQTQGADTLVDSNPDPSSGVTPAYTLTLAGGNTRPVTPADGVTMAAFIDPSIDAGIWVPLAVGDYVWIDTNHNGIQDTNEPGVPGVTVTLLNADSTPAHDANTNTVPATSTDSNGHYVFDNLLPGIYEIQFSNLPATYAITVTGQGTSSNDSNPDATGLTPTFTLAVSATDVRPAVTADGVTAPLINPTIDAGIWQPLAVGNYVWYDTNNNGMQDSGEAPVADVTVMITNPDGTGVLDANNHPINPTRTDGNGWYLFDNLLPGDYQIRFSDLPTGYLFTTPNSTGATQDSNPNGFGITPTFHLGTTSPNVTAPTSSDHTSHLIDRTIDAGIIKIIQGGRLPSTGYRALDLVLAAAFLLGLGIALNAMNRRRRPNVGSREG